MSEDVDEDLRRPRRADVPAPRGPLAPELAGVDPERTRAYDWAGRS